ncbi:MAG: hypothetical protein IJZ80_04725 [Clostridia bacterium]|nr:hypothetical protein [Clostridia bacterium]
MKKQFIRTRKVRFAVITAVLTALVITVAVLANAVFGTLAKRYGWYTSMLATESYDVTDDCFALLGEAFEQQPDAEVEIIFCDVAENLMEESTRRYLYETATAIAERYPDQLTVTCHDIWTNPNTVRQYTSTVNPLTGETVETALKSTSVILVSEGYHRVYALEEFYVFKDGDTSQVWAYNGEKKLAAGILRAISEEEHIVCLTNNHGEIFYDYELLYLLDDAGYSIVYLDLYKDPIPENCEMIISYNPNSDLIADEELSAVSETDILEEFLSEEGHSFWVFVEDGTPELSHMESYLETWGVDFSYYESTANNAKYRYMVQDSSQSLTSDGYTIYGEAVKSGHSAELLDGLDRKVVFKNATAMKAAQGFVSNGDGSFVKGERTMYSLYQSGSNAVSWANGNPVSGEGAILMAMTEQKNSVGSSYVGVISSVDFSAEEFLQSAVYGNGDVILHTMKNMGRVLVPEGLTIKPFSSTDISTITTAQMLYWTIALAAVPAVTVTLVAVAVLVRRRRA